ncbi:MAG: alanine racemase [Coriobacteriales bacterium]|nr:alanine racemase [Coriobacteriales bacterium]
MYPKLTYNAKKLRANIKTVSKLVHDHNVKLAGNLSSVNGFVDIAISYLSYGCDYICDSSLARLQELKKVCDSIDAKINFWLVRPPTVDEINDLVSSCDVSFHSHLQTLRLIDKTIKAGGLEKPVLIHDDPNTPSDASIGQNEVLEWTGRSYERYKIIKEDKIKQHGIVLLVEQGDLGLGIKDYDELMACVDFVIHSSHLKLVGISSSLNLVTYARPTKRAFNKLKKIRQSICKKYKIESLFIIQNSSACINLLKGGVYDDEEVILCMAESLVCGRETDRFTYIESTYDDVFTIEAEIVELKEIDDRVKLKHGRDVFGNVLPVKTRGKHWRAAVALGGQSCDFRALFPFDKSVEVLAESSNCTFVNLGKNEHNYKLGDVLSFKLGFQSLGRFLGFHTVRADWDVKVIEG